MKKIDFVDVATLAATDLFNIDEKQGFEAYQACREFFLKFLPQLKSGASFQIEDSYYTLLDDFQFCDSAYIDNFSLCLRIKLNSPEIYNESIKIIDKHIRPEKRNEGFRYLYQECGSFLVALLEYYKGISNRHALHAARSFTSYSQSTIENIYRKRISGFKKRLSSKLPPPLALATLYWTLYKRGANPENLKPFGPSNLSSKKKNEETISAYWELTEDIASYYQTRVLKHLKKYPSIIIDEAAKSCGAHFPLDKNDIKKPLAFDVFFILCAAFVVELMPEILEIQDIEG